jgi:hypothetical protein
MAPAIGTGRYARTIGRRLWGEDLGNVGLRTSAAVVDREVDAVHRLVLEQEARRVHDLGHRRELARDRLRAMALEDRRRLALPVGAVAGDAGMDDVDPDRGELPGQRARQPETPPFTVETVVEPGYGRSFA